MTTFTLVFEPLDVLIVKDHRPFDAGLHNNVDVRLPPPSTLFGAIRTAPGRGGGPGESPENAHGLLLKQLREWIVREMGQEATRSRVDVMEAVVNMKPDQYRRVSQELMAAAQWLKRFAEGRLPKEDEA